MPERKYFTAREIDALIPQLEQIFDHLNTCRTRAEELEVQSFQEDGVQSQLLHSQAEFMMQAVQDDIDQIQSLGGLTKDIELGLVDFLGDVEGQDVWLCWRRGETSVKFWHPLEGGYRQRRPLSSPATLH